MHLPQIDWRSDDGVFLPMLNDFLRNYFYDKVLAQTVSGRQCVDIGFGTGLLSLMALKHGAVHITAYEMHDARHELGQYVIDQLGLQNQIQLIHGRFDHTQYDSNNVYFTETVSPGLWAENLYQTMPRVPGIDFVPGQYFFDVHAVPIAENFAERLFQSGDHHSFFAPGVDVDSRFVPLINSLIGTPVPPAVRNSGDGHFHSTPVWGGWAWVRRVPPEDTATVGYVVDTKTKSITLRGQHISTTTDIDFTANQIQCTIDIDHTPTLLVPRVGMECQGRRLILDTAESWGPVSSPLLVWQPGTVRINHSLHSGLVTYDIL